MLKTGELPSLKKVLEDPELLFKRLYVRSSSLSSTPYDLLQGLADPASELREIAYNES
jgi:hypothetical protein